MAHGARDACLEQKQLLFVPLQWRVEVSGQEIEIQAPLAVGLRDMSMSCRRIDCFIVREMIRGG